MIKKIIANQDQDLVQEEKIHTKIDYDHDNKKYELSVCPTKNEIIGGAKDGKKFYYTFAFDMMNCISNLIQNKINIESILYASKSKVLECDTTFMILKYRNEEMVLKIFSRPAKDINNDLD